MEMTMITRFCMAQNIRVMIRSLPAHLQEVTEAFTKAFDSDGRGTLQEEIGSFSDAPATFDNISAEKVLSKELYELLRNKDKTRAPLDRAFMQTHIDYRRKRFATASHSMSDSHVIYRGTDGAWYGGRIADIIAQETFSQDGNKVGYEVYLAVEKFATLRKRDRAYDPYLAQNRESGLGCLCYLQPRQPKTLISVGDIVCHSMFHPNDFPGVSQPSVHIMPLLRVSGYVLPRSISCSQSI